MQASVRDEEALGDEVRLRHGGNGGRLRPRCEARLLVQACNETRARPHFRQRRADRAIDNRRTGETRASRHSPRAGWRAEAVRFTSKMHGVVRVGCHGAVVRINLEQLRGARLRERRGQAKHDRAQVHKEAVCGVRLHQHVGIAAVRPQSHSTFIRRTHGSVINVPPFGTPPASKTAYSSYPLMFNLLPIL